MPGDATQDDTAFFVLAAWCPAVKAWRDLPERYASPDDARNAATDRSIYRLAYVINQRTVVLDTFAIVGDD
jgi:hypothetical protein